MCLPKDLQVIVFEYVDPWSYLVCCPLEFRGFVSYCIDDPTRLFYKSKGPPGYRERKLEALAKRAKIEASKIARPLVITDVAAFLLEAVSEIEGMLGQSWNMIRFGDDNRQKAFQALFRKGVRLLLSRVNPLPWFLNIKYGCSIPNESFCVWLQFVDVIIQATNRMTSSVPIPNTWLNLSQVNLYYHPSPSEPLTLDRMLSHLKTLVTHKGKIFLLEFPEWYIFIARKESREIATESEIDRTIFCGCLVLKHETYPRGSHTKKFLIMNGSIVFLASYYRRKLKMRFFKYYSPCNKKAIFVDIYKFLPLGGTISLAKKNISSTPSMSNMFPYEE